MARSPTTAAQAAGARHVALKDPKDFKLIGTPAKRLDTPDKVNGTARYGIDVRLPGHEDRDGGRLPGVRRHARAASTTATAQAVKGVRQVVRLDDAVAVVADHMWAAKKGLAALDIKWDDGANAKLSSADLTVAATSEALQRPGVVAQAGRRCRQGHGGRRHASSRRCISCRSSRMPRWSR